MDSPAKCFKKQAPNCGDPGKLFDLSNSTMLSWGNFWSLHVISCSFIISLLQEWFFCLFISFDNGWRIRFYFQLCLSMFWRLASSLSYLSLPAQQIVMSFTIIWKTPYSLYDLCIQSFVSNPPFHIFQRYSLPDCVLLDHLETRLLFTEHSWTIMP